MVVKAASRAPCGPPDTGRCGRLKPLVGATRNGPEPSVHSAPCPLRKPEVMARPNPMTRRADLLRTLSTGPGCTPASCARSSAHRARRRASPGPASGRSASVPRWPRCSPPSSCWWRSAPSAVVTARRSRRRSSPTRATWSTTRSPSGSAPRWRPSVVTVRVTRRRRHAPGRVRASWSDVRPCDHRRPQPPSPARPTWSSSPTPGTAFPAKIVGTDPQTDLALLSVADGDLQLARLGGSSTAAGGADRGRGERGPRTTGSASTWSPTAT